MFKTVAYSLTALTVISVLAVFIVTQQNEITELRITTGRESGVYHTFGTRLAESLETHRHDSAPAISLDVMESSGSQENIQRIQNGQADFALIENHSIGNPKVRSVAGLYDETLHLLVNVESNIECLKDLNDKRVAIGEEDSGTAVVAGNLLRFAFGDDSTIDLVQESTDQSLPAVSSGELDAVFINSGLGSDLLRQALANPKVRLAPIILNRSNDPEQDDDSEEFISGFRTAFPYAQPASIPMLTYGQTPPHPIPSLSTRAVLVCRRNLSPTQVHEMTEFLFQAMPEISPSITILQGLSEQQAQTHLNFPLHDGAFTYYHRREPGFWVVYAELIGLLVTLAVLAWSSAVAVASYARRSRKNHIDEYYTRIQNLDKKLAKADTPAKISEIVEQIREVEKNAVKELTNEELRADESFVILQQMILSAISKHQATTKH